MKAMILPRITDLSRNNSPLELVDLPRPVPREREILVQVSVCGVCHTELDEIEGRTPPERFPVVLGHQIIGRVAQTGKGAARFQVGDRVGIAWIHHACGTCSFCREGRENLCSEFKATGRDAAGGYAEYTTVTGGLRLPHSRGLHRWRGRAAALRRGHRLPLPPLDGNGGRRQPRFTGLWGFGPPGFENGPAPFPQ